MLQCVHTLPCNVDVIHGGTAASLDCMVEYSGVVSGTTVRALVLRALVLGRFSQKKLKIELKDNAKK